jgi:Spy/CpxP family protein refolding chaperone
MREELAETIEIYMRARMKRFLSLTDDQERKLVPLVEDLFSSRREANRKRRLISMKLRLLLEDEGAEDQEISGLIDRLEEVDAQLHQKEMKVRSETRSCLAPKQQARFIMFQEKFRQEIQERLRRLQQGEGPPPGGGPRRNPPPTGPGGWPPPRR